MALPILHATFRGYTFTRQTWHDYKFVVVNTTYDRERMIYRYYALSWHAKRENAEKAKRRSPGAIIVPVEA